MREYETTISRLLFYKSYNLTRRALTLFSMVTLISINFPSHAAKLEAPLLNSYVYNCQEHGNYGLYTYFILKQQPLSTEMDAAIEQIIFMLTKIRRLNEKINYVPTNERNVLYIPVSLRTQAWLQDPSPESMIAAARWILRYYDYDCANKILANSGNPATNSQGPYLLSSLYKLAPDSAFHTLTLTQDFTHITPLARKFLLGTFFRKTWYRRSWDELKLEQLGVTMQDTLDSYFSRDTTTIVESINEENDANEEETVFIPFIDEPEVAEDTTAAPENDIDIAEINAKLADSESVDDNHVTNKAEKPNGGYIYIYRPQ